MYKWQQRRLVRSILFLILLLLFIIYAWWHRPKRIKKSLSVPISAEVEKDLAPISWKVEPLIDSSYLPAVFEAIKKASSSIDISMYVIRADAKSVITRQLIDEIGRAAARGVKVRILLDRPLDYGLPHFQYNLNAGALLILKKAEVRFDDESSELHEKFLLIDNRKLIIGAHNLTDDALLRNNEISLLCEASGELKELSGEFEEKWERAASFSKLTADESRIPAGDELEAEGAE